jgi:hypothetical protein
MTMIRDFQRKVNRSGESVDIQAANRFVNGRKSLLNRFNSHYSAYLAYLKLFRTGTACRVQLPTCRLTIKPYIVVST